MVFCKWSRMTLIKVPRVMRFDICEKQSGLLLDVMGTITYKSPQGWITGLSLLGVRVMRDKGFFLTGCVMKGTGGANSRTPEMNCSAKWGNSSCVVKSTLLCTQWPLDLWDKRFFTFSSDWKLPKFQVSTKCVVPPKMPFFYFSGSSQSTIEVFSTENQCYTFQSLQRSTPLWHQTYALFSQKSRLCWCFVKTGPTKAKLNFCPLT